MKLHVMFIGSKFIYNEPLKEYVVRHIKKTCDEIELISYYKDGENTLFLEIEKELNSNNRTIIVTTKQNFSTIGKLISTATTDIQVLKDGFLMPQKALVYEEGSYLIEHDKTLVNVLQVDESTNIPSILMKSETTNATIHVFDEEKDTLINILTPIAQTYEVTFEVTTLIDGWQRIDICSKRYGDISNFISASKKLLSNNLIPASNVLEYIIERLSSLGKKITFAESCTGGLLSYYLTKNNGASKILEGALITYSNDLKDNWLAVSEKTLEEFGAVSSEVVREMSEGALAVSHADYAIAVSGIAGDTGGTDEKPVGTVYIGVRSKTDHNEKHLYFNGDRNFVQNQSALYAIKMLLLLDKKTFF
ncbi:CinA family protein [Sulfurimonas marina]|uniref:CinA family protein n=1 Tax=Sulfurimonas marina TaxID=2590551 RepID=A0A7M1AUD3_9BACT|nr:CinA family protein [Sulfurimonas marina]QOP41027.1 CinA family protein [Sulfurimonas marina]